MDDWLILRIKHYARADKNVRNQGAEFYAPHAMIRSDRTRVLSRRPLFPGYGFARHPEGQWIFLRGTFGVSSVLVDNNENPLRLHHREIERLRAREGHDGLVRIEASEFSVGEHVKVEKGVVNFDAIVDGMSGHDRVFVLMQVLGAQRRTEVAVKDITRG